jgi:hypothetical protein
MATLASVLQEGVLVDRKWLSQQGIKATAVDYYLRTNKLEAIIAGLYRKPGPPLKWQNVVYSLSVLGHDVHIGHLTALSYHGYEQYLRLGGPGPVRLYSTAPLPSWMGRLETTFDFTMMRRNPFSNSAVGVVEVPFGTWDWPIRYATPERAFLEWASTIETEEEILGAFELLEGAAHLRPRLLQVLLEACGSIKAKRLFLWLARSAGHSWYRYLDIAAIHLGVGKRQIVPGGALDGEFLITIPRSNMDYKNSL